ncbi:MAG: hypothetical protein KY475_06050 [Planctomycetes bacterium]|nr:hypothetical protein [Planctomycetota bacterium]
MTRIFSSLALFAFLLLVLSVALGLSTGDYNASADRILEAQREVEAVARAPDTSLEKRKAARGKLVAVAAEVEPAVNFAHLHMLVGIAAALVTVLVNSITVTYFIGTTRWVREVAETYRLNPDYTRRSDALKRSTFPWALGAILTILGVIALGAASDPSSGVQDSAEWVAWHYAVAVAGVAFIGWSFLTQARNLAANYQVITEVVADVRRIRQEHGLLVE